VRTERNHGKALKWDETANCKALGCIQNGSCTVTGILVRVIINVNFHSYRLLVCGSYF